MFRTLAALIFSLAILLCGASSAGAAPPVEDSSTIGLEGDGGPRRGDDPAQTAAVEAILESRREARDAALSHLVASPAGVARRRLEVGESFVQSSGDVPTYSSYMVNNWQRQECSNWCGPASMRMALSHMSVLKTQSQLAASVGIGCGGSGTYLGTMHSVLNSIGSPRGFAWDIQWLPYTPTVADKSAYAGRIYVSILGLTGSGRRYPLIGNMYMVPGGPHAPGYSSTSTYKHHVEVSGFKDYGGTTYVQDPASGLPAFPSVPSHYHIESDSL